MFVTQVTFHTSMEHICVSAYVGLARTIYKRCIYGIFSRELTKYTVIYGVFIRFWPTLRICVYIRVRRYHRWHVRCKDSIVYITIVYIMSFTQVAFHTSMERGAGTDANISFRLCGEKGESELQRVVAPREAFERGTVDKLTFKGCVCELWPACIQ